MSDVRVMRPDDQLISAETKRQLQRRVDSIPPQFLYAAGLTPADLFKIRENVPITWGEYSELIFKVARAESLQQEERAIAMWEWQIAQQSQQQQKKIPSWMLITFGVVIFLVIIVLLLRRA
jgi:hypothetical protein